MNFNDLQLKRALSAALLVLLLDVLGMTQGYAQPTGAINGLFSVAAGQQVYFSQGNLQFQASTGTWRFAEHQWDYVGGTQYGSNPYNGTVSGSSNNLISPTYSGWIDLFGYGTSGWNSGVVCYQPWSDTATLSNVEYLSENLVGDYANADWGVYNPISNGGNQPGLWRTLTIAEWSYLINSRPGIRYARATVNGVCGVILLPDGWNEATYSLDKTNKPSASYGANIVSATDWNNVLEANGAVFFPCGGVRGSTQVSSVNSFGHYWSSNAHQMFWFYYASTGSPQNWTGTVSYLPSYGLSVRLVYNTTQISSCSISVSANPSSGGTVSGGGTYQYGSNCTVTATANSGYVFLNWMEDGNVASTSASYSFTVSGNRTLLANFVYSGGGSHEYIDLGLPSGVQWATCNVGANSPELSGDYFAWGETQPKDIYTWNTYQYSMGSMTQLTKYCNKTNYGYNGFTDDLTVLLPQDDAATINWGLDWRMPTQEEWQELIDNTVITWTTLNGVSGRSFTASNGNSLFLPASGYCYDNSIYSTGNYCYYWSSSLYTVSPYDAWALNSNSNNCYMNTSNRHCGHPVRAVHSDAQNIFVVSATASPSNGGLVSGDGIYQQGTDCTVTATANSDYTFTSWTENGTVVSTNASYTFTVTGNRTLVANFTANPVNYNINVLANPSNGGTVSGGGSYQESSNCTVTATANSGYTFTNWTENGNQVSTNASYTFTVTGNRTLVANFTANPVNYNINVSANPSNGGTVSGGGSYQEGSGCTVTATANSGYTFTNWTENGNVVSTNASYMFTVTGNRNLVANFEEITQYIQFDLNDSYGDGWTGNYLVVGYGDRVSEQLTISSGSSASYMLQIPNGSHVTLTWIMGSYPSDCSFTVSYPNGNVIYMGANMNASFIFEFDVDYNGMPTSTFGITVSANPSAGGSVNGAGNFNCGSSCTVTATANSGYTFSNWSENGNQVSTNASYTFTVTGDRTLVANFTANPVNYTIGVSANPSNGGTVSGGGSYQEGSDCTVTATANSGYTFSNWSENGEVVSTEATYTFTVTGDRTLVANFTANPVYYTVNVSANPSGGGNVIGGGTYQQGQTCTLTATANTGYTFTNWTENGEVVSTNATYTFTVSGNRTLVANFNQNGGGGSGNTPTGAINGKFSVSEDNLVYFSQGNLQYKASTDTWKFAENQWDMIGSENSNISENYAGWIDLFGWGTSGYNHGAICYQPWSTSTINTSPINNYCAYGNYQYNLYDQTGQADWGYNPISNGGNTTNQWRTLTQTEWNYLFNTRITVSGIRYAKANVNNVNGVILLPDDWSSSIYSLSNTNTDNASFSSNTITASQWNILEQAGAVFLPAAGYRYLTYVYHVGSYGHYWSASYGNSDGAYELTFRDSYLFTAYGNDNRCYGYSVRLARVAENYSYSINAVANPTEGGEVSGVGTYEEGAECSLTATPNEGYIFVNWTMNGEEVSTEAIYSFTVTEDAAFVANFESSAITQTTSLDEGWNWWSCYVDLEGIDGLGQIEASLGDNGVMIKSRNDGFDANYGSMWVGSLDSINNGSSYLILTNAACEITVTGVAATPSAHSITLSPGWNWIGYPCVTPMSISEALSGLTPLENDLLKSRESFAVYTPGIGWLGTLSTITPGIGLMFESHNTSPVTLTYPNPSKSEALLENITARDNHWEPEMQGYAQNMSVMAIVELEGEELESGQYELAAFSNGECRGSARLMYVEPIHKYMAFLTVYGEGGEELGFGLYDAMSGAETYDSGESLVFEANAVVGAVAVPFVVRFGGMTGMDEFGRHIHLFPNPVGRGENVSLGMAAEDFGEVQIEVINALGAVVSMETSTKQPVSIKAPDVAGAYTLRITVKGKGTCYRKLVVR